MRQISTGLPGMGETKLTKGRRGLLTPLNVTLVNVDGGTEPSSALISMEPPDSSRGPEKIMLSATDKPNSLRTIRLSEIGKLAARYSWIVRTSCELRPSHVHDIYDGTICPLTPLRTEEFVWKIGANTKIWSPGQRGTEQETSIWARTTSVSEGGPLPGLSCNSRRPKAVRPP